MGKFYYHRKNYAKSKDEYSQGLFLTMLSNPEKYTSNLEYIKQSENFSLEELEDRARLLSLICSEVDPKVFEYLVSFWFNKKTPYKTALATDEYKSEYDIRGVWTEGECPNDEKYIAIQCKRWSPGFGKYGKVTRNVMAEIYGKSHEIITRPDTKYVLVTTVYMNEEARAYADLHNIHYVDYSQMSLIIDDIEEDEFLNYLKEKEGMKFVQKNNLFSLFKDHPKSNMPVSTDYYKNTSQSFGYCHKSKPKSSILDFFVGLIVTCIIIIILFYIR